MGAIRPPSSPSELAKPGISRSGSTVGLFPPSLPRCPPYARHVPQRTSFLPLARSLPPGTTRDIQEQGTSACGSVVSLGDHPLKKRATPALSAQNDTEPHVYKVSPAIASISRQDH